MAEHLRDYWNRNGNEQVARDYCQAIINEARTGSELRAAAEFIAAVGMVDMYGISLRDKIFARVKTLVDAGPNANPKPIAEARDLGEALGLLNP